MSAATFEALYQDYQSRRNTQGRAALDAHLTASATRRSCDVPGCDGSHFAKGLCTRHYRRQRARARRGIVVPLDQLDQGFPTALEQRRTVICHTPSCPNQAGGPWHIIGPGTEAFTCARCGRTMTITCGWPEPGEGE